MTREATQVIYSHFHFHIPGIHPARQIAAGKMKSSKTASQLHIQPTSQVLSASAVEEVQRDFNGPEVGAGVVEGLDKF